MINNIENKEQKSIEHEIEESIENEDINKEEIDLNTQLLNEINRNEELENLNKLIPGFANIKPFKTSDIDIEPILHIMLLRLGENFVVEFTIFSEQIKLKKYFNIEEMVFKYIEIEELPTSNIKQYETMFTNLTTIFLAANCLET